MNPTLDAKLVADFPELYAQRSLTPMQSCFSFGFECGDGWYELLRKLSIQLTWIAKTTGTSIEATQVKEKYGTLRFYYNGGDEADIAGACVNHAEDQSAFTCETCGAWGKIRGAGWFKTLCASCAKKQNYPLSAGEAAALEEKPG